MRAWPAACLVILGVWLCGHRGLAAELPRIPACMIVDDPAPFINPRSVKDETVCKEIPTSFYVEFGRWAERTNIKGKFSVVPCLGGVKPIDGSLGEHPGHSRQDRLEWIEMIRTLYAPKSNRLGTSCTFLQRLPQAQGSYPRRLLPTWFAGFSAATTAVGVTGDGSW